MKQMYSPVRFAAVTEKACLLQLSWENRKLFKVQRVKVKSALEGSQGQVNFASLKKVTTTVNHLFLLTRYKFFEEEISNQSSSVYRQGINFIVKKKDT